MVVQLLLVFALFRFISLSYNMFLLVGDKSPCFAFCTNSVLPSAQSSLPPWDIYKKGAINPRLSTLAVARAEVVSKSK
jgi:hypothetical protein